LKLGFLSLKVSSRGVGLFASPGSGCECRGVDCGTKLLGDHFFCGGVRREPCWETGLCYTPFAASRGWSRGGRVACFGCLGVVFWGDLSPKAIRTTTPLNPTELFLRDGTLNIQIQKISFTSLPPSPPFHVSSHSRAPSPMFPPFPTPAWHYRKTSFPALSICPPMISHNLGVEVVVGLGARFAGLSRFRVPHCGEQSTFSSLIVFVCCLIVRVLVAGSWVMGAGSAEGLCVCLYA